MVVLNIALNIDRDQVKKFEMDYIICTPRETLVCKQVISNLSLKAIQSQMQRFEIQLKFYSIWKIIVEVKMSRI